MHWEHKDKDARDRARSTWSDLQNTCALVSSLCVAKASGPAPLDYVDEIRKVAAAWPGPLPPDYDNPTGQPLEEESRDYQEVRGAGDGRRPGQHRAIEPNRGRRAEAGDQRVATHPDKALLHLVDRKTREGAPLPRELEVRLLQLEGLQQGGHTLFFWRAETSAGQRACLSNY